MLANPREIAMRLHSGGDLYLKTYTNLLPHFAQFVDHDITLTALTSNEDDGQPIKCSCKKETNPDCMNIPTPKDDLVNRDQECMVSSRAYYNLKD